MGRKYGPTLTALFNSPSIDLLILVGLLTMLRRLGLRETLVLKRVTPLVEFVEDWAFIAMDVRNGLLLDVGIDTFGRSPWDKAPQAQM